MSEEEKREKESGLPSFSRLARILFERRRQPLRPVLAVAALPLLLFALAGAEYGAFVPYAALAALCLLQAALPTLAGWVSILLVYCLGGGLYFYKLITESIKALRGRSTSLWDGDAVLLVVVTCVFVLLAILLWCARPVELSSPSAPAGEGGQ